MYSQKLQTLANLLSQMIAMISTSKVILIIIFFITPLFKAAVFTAAFYIMKHEKIKNTRTIWK